MGTSVIVLISINGYSHYHIFFIYWGSYLLVLILIPINGILGISAIVSHPINGLCTIVFGYSQDFLPISKAEDTMDDLVLLKKVLLLITTSFVSNILYENHCL